MSKVAWDLTLSSLTKDVVSENEENSDRVSALMLFHFLHIVIGGGVRYDGMRYLTIFWAVIQ